VVGSGLLLKSLKKTALTSAENYPNTVIILLYDTGAATFPKYIIQNRVYCLFFVSGA